MEKPPFELEAGHGSDWVRISNPKFKKKINISISQLEESNFKIKFLLVLTPIGVMGIKQNVYQNWWDDLFSNLWKELIKESEKSKHEFQKKKEQESKKLEEESINKLKKMIKVSDRLNLEMIRKALRLEEITFLDKIFDWAEEFGFRIDGDYLIIKKERVLDFIDLLDKQFASWEKGKEKIE